MSEKVYLITGCSSGLGTYLAHAALATGAKVIATARNFSKDQRNYEELQKAGATWLQLDVTSPNLSTQVQEAARIHGRIDVLINNAGVGGVAGPLEETDLDSARRAFETNFWGTVRTTQAVLPTLRKQGSGTVVNISSASVYDLTPGLAFYAASKSALESMTSCFAPEVAPFGIKVILVTPADMRTPFLSVEKQAQMQEIEGPYEDGPVPMVMQFLRGMDGQQSIDPKKAADRIVEAANKAGDLAESGVIRIPIGKNAGNSMIKYAKGLLERVEATKDTWGSVDFLEGE